MAKKKAGKKCIFCDSKVKEKDILECGVCGRAGCPECFPNEDREGVCPECDEMDAEYGDDDDDVDLEMEDEEPLEEDEEPEEED